MIGLCFRETMSGGYHLNSAPSVDRPMSFTVKVQRRGLPNPLRAPVFNMTGAVVAEGLADHKPLSGTLTMDPFIGKVLVYTFDFEGNDGSKYSFQGKKTLSEGPILSAMTVLPGGIYDASGGQIGEALLRFDLRSDIVKFIRSFRLVRS